MRSIDEDQNGKRIDLAVGETAELRLPENTTAGFSWTVVSDGAPVCSVTGEERVGHASPPGAGGEHVFRLRALKAGEASVELVYRRTWEAAPARRFTLRLRVSAA
jgi:inhibitor of cysteine peptidase